MAVVVGASHYSWQSRAEVWRRDGRQAKSGELWPLQAPARHVIPSLYTHLHSPLFVLHSHLSRTVSFSSLVHFDSRTRHITPQSCSATTTTTIRSPCTSQLDRHLSASAKPVPLQLAARPYLPGRIRPRSRQARFRRRWHCQQDSCCPRRSQGPPPNTALCAVPTTDSIVNSVTPKSSHPTKRRSSPSTRTTALPSPVSPQMPASSATS
jgi:hypothetical protein